jgi:hypothetical protein
MRVKAEKDFAPYGFWDNKGQSSSVQRRPLRCVNVAIITGDGKIVKRRKKNYGQWSMVGG